MVGISISFIGQTGAGIVIPIVLLMTGDPLLAIATNILNDLIAVCIVLISYIKNGNYHWNKNFFYFLLFSILTSIGCIVLLMFTDLGSAVSWLLPILFIFLGLAIFRRGFPTAESIKQMVHSIIKRKFKDEKSEKDLKEFEEKMAEQIEEESDEIVEGLIPIGSRLYYITLIVVGIILGGNSGLFGSSGGFIIAIALILFGYPLKKAVGTGLLLSVFICLSTYIIFQIMGLGFKNQVYFDLEISLFLTIGTVIMGFIASTRVQKLSANVMGKTMGAIMVLLGISTLLVYLFT